LSRSAWRWAALSLHLAGSPGERKRLIARGGGSGGPASALRSAACRLGPGWEEAARAELDRARRFGATVLTLEDDEYPPLLRVSSDPPPLLYVWGRLRPEDALAVAIVGSRRATPHGTWVARRIAKDLASAGFVVVSGLARGIDAAGHRGALEANGRTLAVLGSGLDRIYPAEHRRLAESIAARGAVLSECPFGAAPLRRNFPERNRLIAWLSWATVVVEAARDSGSLITADLAADEGRAVHAVPGPVDDPNAEGTNALLRAGALVCRDASDVLEDLAPQIVEVARRLAPSLPIAAESPSTASLAGATADQKHVLARIPATRGIGIERLGEACRLPPGPLLAILLELELQGLVRELPGRRFIATTCNI
jgi:DNA processing protein